MQTYGIAGWKWLFIVLSICGSGLAVISLFILPDYPHRLADLDSELSQGSKD